MFSTVRRTLKFILLTAITVAFVVFAVVNRQFIHVSFFPLPYSADMPQFLFAIICFALGVVAGSTGISLKLSRSKHLLKKEHKHVMALQDEVSALHGEKPDALPAALPKA